MATYEKRGKSWRATVRKRGEARQSASFPTKGMAQVWAERIERGVAERKASGSTEADTKTLKELIEWYEEYSVGLVKWGRSKSSDLKRLRGYSISERVVSSLRSRDYIRHIEERRKGGSGPATALNDMVWIRQIVKAGRGALGLTAPLSEIEDAVAYLRQHKLVAKSKKRKRRLGEGEEERIIEFFQRRDQRSDIPMVDIVQFALSTARRQEEICRLKWCDVDAVKGIAWLDDVKHPSQKIGNRRAFRVLPEAMGIINRQPKIGERVFPHNHRSISSAFTRAMQFLGIVDLHFHDLRREATSRLFERGYSIQEVAQFTLHDSWATLKIYTELKPEDVLERHKPT